MFNSFWLNMNGMQRMFFLDVFVHNVDDYFRCVNVCVYVYIFIFPRELTAIHSVNYCTGVLICNPYPFGSKTFIEFL